jgi:biotin transport system substrate-specific component
MSNPRSQVSTSAFPGWLVSPLGRQLIGVIAFTVLTAFSAKLSVPIPGTSVPFTFQPMVVLLAGLYLLAGMIGLPVFALPGAGPAYLLGPTGGYLLAYPLAAFIAGSGNVGRLRVFGALLAGLAAIYLGGVAWLSILDGWSAAVMLGLAPFLFADLIKVAIAWVLVTQAGARTRAFFNG